MLELQRKILGDKLRNEAFYQALKRTIRPGESIVCDIGSGTGFLSLLASKLGAKECWMFERDPQLSNLSRDIAHENGVKNCHCISQDSLLYAGKIQADILISETLGNFALEENILENIEDAKRYLKPHGTIIPAAVTQYVAPVLSPRLYEEINVWNRIGYDLTFEKAKRASLNNIYVRSITLHDIGGDTLQAREWSRIEFAKQNKSTHKATLRWKADASQTIYGFALWWRAQLTENTELSTSPHETQTHWEQIYMPVYTPICMEQNDEIRLSIVSDTRKGIKINVTWDISVWSQGTPKEYQHFNMQDGMH